MDAVWLPWRQTKPVKQIMWLLFVAIWILSLTSFTLFIYTENTSTSLIEAFNKDRLDIVRKADLQKTEEGETSDETTVDPRERIFARNRLTKSVYPLTLTVPYLIENPQICDGRVDVLIIVHTAIFHFERRINLRLTIGSSKLFKEKYKIRIAFLLGLDNEPKLNLLIKQENDKHHDIVQAEFDDTYRNLTLKGVLGFRWIYQHCSHASIVLKIDDDIFVNIFKIVEEYLPRYVNQRRRIVCNTVFPGPVLRRRSRWRVEDDEFRNVKNYPRYCSGFAVLMTTDTVMALYHAAYFTPVFWVDDVYLFGLLPAMANITHRSINSNVTLHTSFCEASYSTDTPGLVVCSASRTYEYEFYWKRSLQTLNAKLKKLIGDEFLKEAAQLGSENVIMQRRMQKTTKTPVTKKKASDRIRVYKSARFKPGDKLNAANIKGQTKRESLPPGHVKRRDFSNQQAKGRENGAHKTTS